VAQVEVLLPPAIAAYVLPPPASGVLAEWWHAQPGRPGRRGINNDGSLNYAASSAAWHPEQRGLTYWTGSAVRVATYLTWWRCSGLVRRR